MSEARHRLDEWYLLDPAEGWVGVSPMLAAYYSTHGWKVRLG